MRKYILDASAVLALVNQETGADKVEQVLPDAIISTVNYSEVASVLNGIGMSLKEIEELIPNLVAEIVPFEEDQALLTAELRGKTKHKGLSLGDRACLALGKITNFPILTADKAWGTLELGLELIIIR